jgi:hypothetical protein
MRPPRKLNTRSLVKLSWRAGFRGVSGLAKALGVHRVSVYRAVRDPKRHSPTYNRVEEALAKAPHE